MKTFKMIIHCIIFYLAMVGCVAILALLMGHTLGKGDLGSVLNKGIIYGMAGFFIIVRNYRVDLAKSGEAN